MIPSSSYDRVKTYLKRVIDTVTKRMDFMALYPCKVVSQNGDNTLELTPDNPALPSHSRVPLRLGIPGATAKVQPGSRVLLGFEGGDPRAPIATLWDSGSVILELDIGSSPSSWIALATQTKAALDDIKATFNAHTHSLAAVTYVNSVGVTTPVAGAMGAGPSSTVSTNVASSTVKST